MTLSQRLTRAGLTFILLGSVAAVMPQQSGSAAADSGPVCQNGSTYVLRLTNDTSTTYGGSAAPNPVIINVGSSTTGATNIRAFVSTDGGTTFKAATTGNFSGRTLTFPFTNDASSQGPITFSSTTATPGNTNTNTPISTSNGGGIYAGTSGTSGMAPTTGTVNASFTYTPSGGSAFTLNDARNVTTP